MVQILEQFYRHYYTCLISEDSEIALDKSVCFHNAVSREV
jgi:hypothetical protein